MTTIKDTMLRAILSDLYAREERAKATIKIYFENPAGVADHSEILDEIVKWANIAAEARDAREDLIEEFDSTGEEQ